MFAVDVMSRTPIYEQLTEQIERSILSDALACGCRLPSVRRLSSELEINPNTVQRAYADLCARGVLCAVPGRGCFVATDGKTRLQEKQRGKLTALEICMRELQLAGLSKTDLQRVLDDVYSEGRDG